MVDRLPVVNSLPAVGGLLSIRDIFLEMFERFVVLFLDCGVNCFGNFMFFNCFYQL